MNKKFWYLATQFQYSRELTEWRMRVKQWIFGSDIKSAFDKTIFRNVLVILNGIYPNTAIWEKLRNKQTHQQTYWLTVAIEDWLIEYYNISHLHWIFVVKPLYNIINLWYILIYRISQICISSKHHELILNLWYYNS